MLLSSHLLGEVERICDHVAIVDRGRVVMQGTLAELAAGGDHAILVATSDDEQALAVLSAHRAVDTVALAPEGIRVTLLPDVDGQAAADDIGRRLVREGLALRRFERARGSLEDRFLEITSPLVS